MKIPYTVVKVVWDIVPKLAPCYVMALLALIRPMLAQTPVSLSTPGRDICI